MTQVFEHIHDADYRRSREAPPLGHPHYIHLADLLLALEQVCVETQGRWLDYGSGASPYRVLFADCDYRRADLHGDDLDYVIRPGEPLPAPDASFDGILSTQVLEHVADPPAYLQDCRRLLRPGGRLLLSTHGTWKEHGVPHDYWRWTRYGLRAQMEQAGFHVRRIACVSTGPRAMLNLLFTGRNLEMGFGGQGPRAWLLDRCFRWIARQRKLAHRLSDQVHRPHRVAWESDERFYLVLLVEAIKPLDP